MVFPSWSPMGKQVPRAGIQSEAVSTEPSPVQHGRRRCGNGRGDASFPARAVPGLHMPVILLRRPQALSGRTDVSSRGTPRRAH